MKNYFYIGLSRVGETRLAKLLRIPKISVGLTRWMMAMAFRFCESRGGEMNNLSNATV
jgi:hypothetical protein